MKNPALGFLKSLLPISATLVSTANAAVMPLPQDPATSDPPTITPAEKPPAEGQDPQESQSPKPGYRVLVTAQKWGQESVIDLPRSITPISAKLIRDAGLTSIEQAARYVPGMLVTGFTARRLSFPYVRGIGSGQGDPAVATFVDDVPQLSTSNTNLPLVGLDRIEFLRGPAGSLWGRNTIGGAINMHTRLPSHKGSSDFGATFGNFNSRTFDVNATGSISDTLAMSFSGSREMRDGFTRNNFTGNDVDYRDSAFARAQVLWTPNDDSTVRFTFHGETAHDGGFALSDLGGLRTNPFAISQDFEGETNRRIMGGSMVWNQQGDNFDFVSITSVQGWDIDESSDFDFLSIDGVRRYTVEEEDYVYQEFRLESAGHADAEAGDGTGPRWVVGASSFYSDSNRSATNEFRPSGAGILFPATSVGSDSSVGDFRDWSVSAFGQVGMRFGNGWDATAALRYDHESKKANINRVFNSGGFMVPLASTQREESYDRVLPRFSLSYRFCEDLNTYVLAAKGFKAGGFNLTAPTGQEAFGPENSWTYELGCKTEWCDDRITANVALFHIDWDDMQLSQFDANAGGYVTNAGKSTSQGIEVELAGRPFDQLTLFGTAGFMDTEFDAYIDPYGQNTAGNHLPFAPEFTVGLGGQYTHELCSELSAFARVDYFHVGEFFYDAGNIAAEEYDLTNFRVGVRGKHWSLDGFVMNAFDEDYVPIAFQQNPGDPTMFVGSNAAPRTYGIGGRFLF